MCLQADRKTRINRQENIFHIFLLESAGKRQAHFRLNNVKSRLLFGENDVWPSSLVVHIDRHVCVYHQAFDVNVYLRSFFLQCDQSKNDESVTSKKE